MLQINHIKEIFRPYRVVIIVFILIAFFLRIPLLQIRYFDPDEFQHLHSARQIYNGEIPYRDYFDHHTPFLHFILSGLYPIVGEDINILFVARSLMLVFTAVIFYLTFILAKQLYGVDAGLYATLFLSYVLIFLEKTLEIRPDLGAVIFWLASMIFMIKGLYNKTSWKWYLLSGLSMGTALMFTQKSMFGLPGIFIALAYPFIDRRVGIAWRQHLRLTLAFLIGIATPVLLTCLFFLAHGALWDFINCNFIMNSHWKLRFSPLGYIKQMFQQNPFFPIMGLAGLLVNIFWMTRREEIAKGIFVPIFCTISVLVGLFILPVPYRQYYQIFIPLLAIYSGFIIKKCIEFDFRQIEVNRKTIFSFFFAGIILGLVIANLIFFLNMSKPALTNLNSSLKFLHQKPNMLYLIIWIPFIISAVLTFIFGKRKYAFMLISIGIIIHPLDQMITQFSQKNDGQIASIQYIMANTDPSEAVLDGWSGYGFLRPNAYYYFFLHSEMRAMLNEKELTDDLIKSIEGRNTKIVIYDGDLKTLPKKTQDYITTNFVPTGQGDLYIRKKF
jgi:4-amino-4-deoxy-L-arabinose transferase-like glycosyltransferase